MKPVFTIWNLRHEKGGRQVLAIPRLTLGAPGLAAVVGDNGAGKTTFLRLLTGWLETPTAGTVNCSVPPFSIVLVEQSPYMFSTSVAGNVGYGLKVRGISRSRRGPLVAEALAEVGLAGYGSRPARELSGGEQRRVATARALAVNPDVLLLDEPDAGLDQRAVRTLESLILALGKNRLVIFSTHNRVWADRLADRVIHLDRGRLVEDEESVRTDAATGR